MKSPCEILIECDHPPLAERWLKWGAEEAWRIEQKFSRFRPDSVIGQINTHPEQWIPLDQETEALLNFADQCWQLSDGMIDITIGTLMRLWRFDGSSPPPSRKQLKQALKWVGWSKIKRRPGEIYLPAKMCIDLGGIGKEYAVDKIATRLSQQPTLGGVLVNLGGDIQIGRARQNGKPWHIAIEPTDTAPKHILPPLTLQSGGVATSGNTKRYAVDHRKRRLGHILNPRTGWPVRHSPASVTVIAQNATLAGLLATLAMLQGKNAEIFLKDQAVDYYCQWPDSSLSTKRKDTPP